MRRLRYSLAATLDGFIADPHGGYDWIVMDDPIDFPALFSEFDTAQTAFVEMLRRARPCRRAAS